LLGRLSYQQAIEVMMDVIKAKAAALPPEDSLKGLFELENILYRFEGQEAVRYGKGLHTKHKHIKYHDFFLERIEPGSKVFDIGCGNGALTHDNAVKIANVSVFCIDKNPKSIEIAQKHYVADNLVFVCGDALSDLPDSEVDVIILSNVLEHLEKRVDFLQGLQKRYHPHKFLLRVPIFERDWRVPLKQELGIDYRLDPTHCIEYRQGEFAAEMAQAGLRVQQAVVNWGEIWAEVVAEET
jgi:SAM-dependent methyltransferase